MKAIARMVWSYFTPMPWVSAVSALGLILTLAAFIHWWLAPSSGNFPSLLLPVLAVCVLYAGSVPMPLMAGRLARSHAIHLLPGGRVKLLASVLITILLVSLIAPFFWALGAWGVSAELVRKFGAEALAQYRFSVVVNFLTIYSSGILMSGWLYLSLWYITGERNTAGFVKGLLVMLLALLSPTREIETLQTSLSWNLGCVAFVWVTLGGGFLLWPRIGATLRKFRPQSRFSPGRLLTRQVEGHEFDLMLGTANPWILAMSLVVPGVLAAQIGDYSAGVWLFFLTIFSTVSGAVAGQASARSRGLWLRARGSRSELFRQVERSFWRHNLFVLGALLLLLLLIGRYAELPTSLLAVGVPLLILGTTASTYLGLMITRGLGWLESTLGIVLMISLMIIAMLVAEYTANPQAAIAFELLLAIAAIAFRFIARARWAGIDWSLCRPERLASGRDA